MVLILFLPAQTKEKSFLCLLVTKYFLHEEYLSGAVAIAKPQGKWIREKLRKIKLH